MNMWRMSSSYKLSKQQDRAGVGAGGVDRCERFAGGRGAGESDLLAIAEDGEVSSGRIKPGDHLEGAATQSDRTGI